MKVILLLLLLAPVYGLYQAEAQNRDSTFLDEAMFETSDTALIRYTKVRFTHPKNQKIDVEEVYYKSGQLYSRSWIRVKDRRDNLLFKRIFYENKQLQADFKFDSQGRPVFIKTFWEDGTLRRDELYEKTNRVKANCFNRLGQPIAFVPYKVNASFPGGSDSLNIFIRENLQYPEEALANYTEGSVTVRFNVDTLGNLGDVKCLTSGNLQLDQEAIRVVESMPKWHPAIHEGEKIKVRVAMPINFTIDYNVGL